MLKSAHALAATLLAGLAAPAAFAGTPSGPYAVFAHCPYATEPAVQVCVYSTIASGSFKMGNATVPISATITLQGGVESLGLSPFYAAVGAPSMSPTPQEVPGGLTGLALPSIDWPLPLITAFWNIVLTANRVTAVTEPAGPISVTFANAIYPPDDGSDATVLHQPIRVRLQNPFLGNTCYIGSFADPIVLNLVTNTTNPPPPNQPISGSTGTVDLVSTTNPDGFILHVTDSTMVDNSFAVPAAKGCGNVALGLPIITEVLDFLVSGVVNLKEGLPSAAGKNTAILNADVQLANSAFVQASEQ